MMLRIEEIKIKLYNIIEPPPQKKNKTYLNCVILFLIPYM